MDAGVLIAAARGGTEQAARALAILDDPDRQFAASVFLRLEGFFSREGLELVEVDAGVIEQATDLRAKHNFRAPDAIHIASALMAKADIFLTGDRTLERCPGLTVEVLSGPRTIS